MDSIKKILIVDDHQMFIDGLKSILLKQKDFNVCAEALDGESALAIIRNSKPDIVITDISMPGMSGIDLTRIIKSESPEIKVIVVSMHNDSNVISDILMAEAEGYILKNTGKNELIEALTKVSNNGTYYSNAVISTMIKHVKKDKEIHEEVKILTEREFEVLKLIAEEYSSEQIADKLFISKRTVDSHRANILSKLNIKTLAGLIKYAIHNNIIV
ncbi:MAG TPA: response regulator transcription factor [Bacteroidales bacterium]|nr:response regulator transcription factor [Bacteroidales bacterium]